MVDNSCSMNEIMRHPAIDAASLPVRVQHPAAHGTGTARSTTSRSRRSRRPTAATPTSAASSRSTTTPRASPPRRARRTIANNGYITRKFCGQTRKIWVDGQLETLNGNTTWWLEDYLEWYFTHGHRRHHHDLRAREPRPRPQIIADIDDSANGTPLHRRRHLRALPALAHHRRARDRARRDLQDQHERRAVRGRLPAGLLRRTWSASASPRSCGSARRLREGADRRLQHQLDRPRHRHHQPRPDLGARRSPRRSSSSTRTS